MILETLKMDKLDILFRKLCAKYDEDYTLEHIIPTEEDFNRMADDVRLQSKFTYDDSEFNSIKEQVRELRAATIGIGIGIDKPSEEHELEWCTH